MFRRILLVLRAAALAIAAASSTRAAVVPFDIPDVTIVPAGAIPGGNFIGGAFTYYNIQYDIDGGGLDLNLRTARAIDAGGPGVDQVVSDGLNSSQIVTKGANFYLNTPFVAGDLIGDGLNETPRGPDNFNVINDGGFQMYNPGSNNYLGFKLASGNYGYLQVSYDAAGSAYTFTGGAYESSGAPLIAGGSVPEPATVVLLTLGGLGVCAMRRGRARAK